MADARKERLVRVLHRLKITDTQRLPQAFALGGLVAASPFYGLQVALVTAAALALRVNPVAANVAVQIANPLTIPFFIAGNLWIGHWLATGEATAFAIWLAYYKEHPAHIVLESLLGWAVSGPLLAIFAALCGLALRRAFRKDELEVV